jgi:hypothetical protein
MADLRSVGGFSPCGCQTHTPRVTCQDGDEAAAAAGEIGSDIAGYELMRGVGNLCIGADNDPRYDARRLVELLVEGLRRRH